MSTWVNVITIFLVIVTPLSEKLEPPLHLGKNKANMTEQSELSIFSFLSF